MSGLMSCAVRLTVSRGLLQKAETSWWLRAAAVGGDGEQRGAVEWQLLAITLLRRKTRRGGRCGAEVIKAPLGPWPLITGNVSTPFTPRLDHVATIGALRWRLCLTRLMRACAQTAHCLTIFISSSPATAAADEMWQRAAECRTKWRLHAADLN